ncbi:MAG: tRNA uridine-5-carboxymethylaminomethyl(34) synthesis enzyme MnmG, partial [Burkholderiales bacterium]|nr:tRNA uridine-5-carboxymethylaminomethyl(34) synthesis enzyme MnmG [Burkholderiales bacterium]
GVTEPYRMFTSRAEHRLSLREDNADLRLTEAGRRLGLVDDSRWARFDAKREAVARERERLKSTWLMPRLIPVEATTALFGQPLERDYTLEELLRRPGVGYSALMALAQSEVVSEDPEITDQVEIQVKYQGYIERQQLEIGRTQNFDDRALPADLDYASVRGLSKEVQQKLNQHRPETLGQASRISGITPAAISLLLVHLKRGWRTSMSDAPAQAVEQ